MVDGKLVADCTDRCFPFMLTFEHLTANKFVVDRRYTWDTLKGKLRGEARIEDGKVTSVGVELEEDVEGGLIWFNRVE
jgi:hypothetical protein